MNVRRGTVVTMILVGIMVVLFAFPLLEHESVSSPISLVHNLSASISPSPFSAPFPSPTLPPSSHPQEVLLDVPFVSQAPTRSWIQPYQDACEEAALLSAYLWSSGTAPTRPQIHEALLRLVRIGATELHQPGSISAKRMHELATRAYPALDLRFVPRATLDDVKRELAGGHVVILPMAGRKLDGPYYRPPGPVYHALVMRGYADRAGVFIVNDVGTNTKGEAFRFSAEAIRRSWNNWDDGRQTLAAPDASHPMLVVTRSTVLRVTLSDIEE